jgi:deazaflavin-dependent oxidoreductase (nitroreductase family)
MTEDVQRALATDNLIDITTTGRRSGEPRRIETWFYRADGKLYLTGLPSPKKRDWLLNIEANPEFTFHLKDSTSADLAARGTAITAEPERRRIIAAIIAELDTDYDVDEWVAQSPLVEIELAA